MNLIVVLDRRNGMMFNHRRQSRDRVLTERILQISGGKLIVSPYTARLFEGLSAELTIAESPAAVAAMGQWCFVEDGSQNFAIEAIERLVVFRWDRVYPADVTFPIDVSRLKLQSQTDFAGSSHEKITQEEYRP